MEDPLTGKPWRTLAVVSIDEVLAGAVVLAGLRETLVVVEVAVVSEEARSAVALVRAHLVLADAVDAGVVHRALIQVLRAVPAWGSSPLNCRKLQHNAKHMSVNVLIVYTSFLIYE